MVVIVLEKCPLALRGDLTKWLQEISLGVYVGQMSARVRDELWERVCDECKSGRATMVYSARNEQHLNFKVHNTTWEPIDFDGIKLMMHPSPARTKALGKRRIGWSDAYMHSKAKRHGSKSAVTEPNEYVVVDVETTGLDVDKDEVIEIAAIKVVEGDEVARFHTLVHSEKSVPKGIAELTGITDDLLKVQGVDLESAIKGFIDFVGESIVVAHNAEFDFDFIQAACEECDLDDFDNEFIDTVALAKRKMPKARNYRLSTLLDILNLDNERPHRAKSDCDAELRLFHELMKI
jgi:CRISPR-associated protein Cas2